MWAASFVIASSASSNRYAQHTTPQVGGFGLHSQIPHHRQIMIIEEEAEEQEFCVFCFVLEDEEGGDATEREQSRCIKTSNRPDK